MEQICIIVGAGHAGAQLAASLRQEGWTGRITMVGDEPWLPYNRPPLSKAYLAGEKTFDEILIRHAEFYERQGIELVLNASASSIDRPHKAVVLSDGARLAYDKLALCTGARVRRLPEDGFDNVLYLRNRNDLEALRVYLRDGARAVIIGGGYIGLEAAAVLRKFAVSVTVIEAASRVLARVTAPELSQFYQRVHAEKGVEILTGCAIAGLVADAKKPNLAVGLELDNGRSVDADFIVVGIGVVPNTELAEAAGLEVSGGIVTDICARTSDPDIFAAGDCTVHPVKDFGTLRLESVGNAVEQAKAAASAICGKPRPDHSLPWFWSDQYDLKLQTAGISTGYDRIVMRGDAEASASFAAFYLRQGRLIAADCVNRASEFLLSKKLIAEGREIAPEQLADDSRPFKEIVA